MVTTLCWGVWGAFIEAPEKRGFPATLSYVVWSLTMIPCAAIALSLVLLEKRAAWPIEHLAIGSALVAVTLLAGGGLFERRAWARPLEVARLVAIAALGTFAFVR